MSGGDAFAALVEAACGASASAISTATLYPLEIAKARLVARTGSKHASDTTLSVLRKIVKDGSVLDLYRGLQAKCVHSVAQAFNYFYAYSFLKSAAEAAALRPGVSPKPLGTAANLVVGYLAGVGNVVGTTPLEVVALKMQVSEKKLSPLQAARAIYADGGFGAFYRGLVASLILCTNPAINLTVFDQLKVVVMRILQAAADKRAAAAGGPSRRVVALSAGQAFLVGVVAKSIATLITYPYIRVKTVMQALSKREADSAADEAAGAEAGSDGGQSARPARPKRKLNTKMGTWEVLQYILSTEGLSGVFKGLQPQLFRSVLASALMLMLKERIYFYTRALLLRLAKSKA